MSVNPSQHLPRSRELLLPVLNKSLFLSVWLFLPQSLLSSPWRFPRMLPLYSTAVWKQAPTRFFLWFSQSFWHCAYHLPQDFVLRISQLPGVHCQLPATCHGTSSPGNKANPLLVEPLPVWCPTNSHRESVSLGSITKLSPGQSSKTLHVSVSSLYCSRAPKCPTTPSCLHSWKPIPKADAGMGAQAAGDTMLWWAQIWTQLCEQVWFTGKSYTDSKCYLWSSQHLLRPS